MTKSTRLNLRISEDFRADLKTLADYNGITLSSMAHSLLVRAVRKEKMNIPDAFHTNGSKEARLIETDDAIVAVQNEGTIGRRQQNKRKAK